MNGQRVQIISGNNPIILVAPHGFSGDDENTGELVELMAKNMDCYGVINWGFERSDKTDHLNDKADCNNCHHCHEPVIKDEFLDPIIRYKNKILNTEELVHIYYIHGMSNKHRKLANDPNLSMVIGYGAGSPNSFSCKLWQKDLLLHLLDKNGIVAYEGKKGGLMSGWSRSNMNQLFRKWYNEEEVKSMQIEIIYDLRCNTVILQKTAAILSNVLCSMLRVGSFTGTKVYNNY